ncbi:hypothetical protein CDD83_7593 [Cordyceps sp. RAO-2017]|nr:hypothetical protein CDD83_7593 [Cordyceps sp. RAO-2017]
MGQPATAASNAIIYVTYGAFLITGTGIAWTMRRQSKREFLSSNGTQSAFPLALNFIASAFGTGILFSYPELATVAGVQGVIVYAFASSLPMLVFGAVGPVIRRKCPSGFVLTEWTRQRYGSVTMLYLSFLTLLTLFLYMVADLSALGQVVEALTGLDKLPVIIVECFVTTVYTSLGGFRISFLTDAIQGAMVVGLLILATITIGVKTDIRPELIDSSGLTRPSLLGWQLLYILPVAVVTNDFFLSSFWLRTFSSRSDRDLWVAVSLSTAVLLCATTLVGCTGLIAVWSGAWPGSGAAAAAPPPPLFALLERMPGWVVGVVLVMTVTLSTAAFDSLQSAMVSSASNDLFRNRLSIWYTRAMVVAVIVPVVVVALKAASILQIYLICDLLSAATVPVLCVGLVDRFHFWRGFEVVVGGLGGVLSVFVFGTVYLGSAAEGARLLILQRGLYASDWSAFGAFVAAPLGGLLCGLAALGLRLAFQFVRARAAGERFDALDRPPADTQEIVGDDPDAPPEAAVTVSKPGKFF